MESVDANNSAIESYYHCQLWQNDLKLEKREVLLFEIGPEMRRVQKSVARRLGFSEPFSVGKFLKEKKRR